MPPRVLASGPKNPKPCGGNKTSVKPCGGNKTSVKKHKKDKVHHFSFMLLPHVWTSHVYTLLSVVGMSCSSFSQSSFLSPSIIETRIFYSSSLHPHTLRCTPDLTGYAEKHLVIILQQWLVQNFRRAMKHMAHCSCILFTTNYCAFHLHQY